MPDDPKEDERTYTAEEVQAAIEAAKADATMGDDERKFQTMIDRSVDRALSEDRIEGVVTRFRDRVAGDDDDDDTDRSNAPGGSEPSGLVEMSRKGLGIA
jgi:hypothetical protein